MRVSTAGVPKSGRREIAMSATARDGPMAATAPERTEPVTWAGDRSAAGAAFLIALK
jgi:hypothetical protein